MKIFKSVLDNVLLGSLKLVDNSLGAIYFVLDVSHDGLEANKVKDAIILPQSVVSSSSSSPAGSSTPSSSTPRSSSEFGVEDHILLHDGCSPTFDDDHLQMLSISTPPPKTNHNSKPRRAGIIAERQQMAKNSNDSCSGGAPCTCWGWQIEEESPDEQMSIHDRQQELLDNSSDEDDCNQSISPEHDPEHDEVKVRWSECQCPDCRKLYMPMSKARSRLHVQTWNNTNSTNSDLDSSRTTIKSCSSTTSGNSIDQAPESKCLDRRRSLGRLASSTLGSGNWNWDSNSNGAKSIARQSSVNCSGNVVEEKEKKTGIIFLHGVFSSSDFWFDSNIVPVLDGDLKTRHLILAPDLLGCGRSPRPHDSVYTLSDQVDALENSLLKKHALESFHIVGHSMGTIPALALAARFPNRVRSVTLIAPVYTGYTDPKQGGEEILTDCNSILSYQDPWSARALRSLTASQHYNINRFLSQCLFSHHQFFVPIFQRLLQSSWPKSFVRDYLAVTHDAAWHIVHNTMIGGSHALVPALGKLRDRGMRVSVIHGTDDTSCPFNQSVLMTQHFKNVVLSPVPGKGHVDVVLGRDDEVLPLLEKEIRLGDQNFTKAHESTDMGIL